MSVLLYGSSSAEPGTYERRIHDGFVPWVVKRIPHMFRAGVKDFGPCIIFVVASSAETNARILAAVVFHNFNRSYRIVEVSMAADNPLWCRPRILSSLLGYVFDTAGCVRLQAVVPRKGKGPKHTRHFLENMGFKYEGVGRKAFGTDDAVMFSMLREDASRWLGEVRDARAA